jgi:DNA-binding Lrp family transcriptional regulator
MLEKSKDSITRKLGIDEKDKIIMSELSQNPHISQQILAEKTKLSQPAIGMRVLKLKRKGIIAHNVGLNFKEVDMFLGKVDVTAKDPEKIIKEFDCCPYFLNGLIMSGESNLCLFFMGPTLKILETIVNHHLRSNENVSNVKLNIMINSARDFIFPVNFDDSGYCKSKACKEEEYEIVGKY